MPRMLESSGWSTPLLIGRPSVKPCRMHIIPGLKTQWSSTKDPQSTHVLAVVVIESLLPSQSIAYISTP